MHHIFSQYGPVERVQVVIDAKVCRTRLSLISIVTFVFLKLTFLPRLVALEDSHSSTSKVTRTPKPLRNSVQEWRLTEGAFE